LRLGFARNTKKTNKSPRKKRVAGQSREQVYHKEERKTNDSLKERKGGLLKKPEKRETGYRTGGQRMRASPSTKTAKATKADAKTGPRRWQRSTDIQTKKKRQASHQKRQ